MTSSLPPAPPPPSPSSGLLAAAEVPRELRLVVLLLMINLALSLAVTIATVLARHSIVDYQLDHRHITDPAVRDTLRHSYVYSIIS